MGKQDEIFDAFVKKYTYHLTLYCTTKYAKLEDAEEIINSAFYLLSTKWDNRRDLPETENIKWIVTVINYLIKNHKRKVKRHEVEDIDDYTNILASEDSIDSFIDKTQYQECLSKIYKSLKPDDIKLFEYRFILNLEYSEIEKKMGISSNVLRVRLSRIRNKLKKIL